MRAVILGIMGKAGAGKDTFADILVRDHEFVKIGLADPMKRFLREIFDFSDEQLFGPSEARNAPDPRYVRDLDTSRALPIHLTPRYALQKLGTEWGRECYQDVWIDYALRAARCVQGGAGYAARRGVIRPSRASIGGSVVIPDVRFQNEYDAIRAVGGRVVRIRRPGTGSDSHVSETEQETIVCVDEYHNTGTIADMERHILEWLRIGQGGAL